jgi:hypothetical protein
MNVPYTQWRSLLKRSSKYTYLRSVFMDLSFENIISEGVPLRDDKVFAVEAMLRCCYSFDASRGTTENFAYGVHCERGQRSR